VQSTKGTARSAVITLVSALTVVGTGSLGACGGDGEEREIAVPAPSGDMQTPAEQLVAVREVRLGTAVAPGGGVEQEVETFQPGDTIYMSAQLEGTIDQAILVARWTHESGAVVGEQQRFLPVSGKEIFVFHLAPPGGLAPGRYRAELLLGNEVVGEGEFTISG
jgi:hypothetical protein